MYRQPFKNHRRSNDAWTDWASCRLAATASGTDPDACGDEAPDAVRAVLYYTVLYYCTDPDA